MECRVGCSSLPSPSPAALSPLSLFPPSILRSPFVPLTDSAVFRSLCSFDPPSIDAKRKSEGGEGQGEENDVEKSESNGWEYPLKPVRSITAPLHCTKNENEPTSPSAVSCRRIEPRDSFFIYLYIYSYLLANMLLC